MSKMIDASISDALAGAVHSRLDLGTGFRRRVSVGIKCSTCSRIDRSIFDSSPKRIAASLLAHRGIEVTRLDFGLPEKSPPGHLPWSKLYRIEAFRAEPSTRILREPGKSGLAARPKTLPSNQILMGIISSARPLHTLEVSKPMVHVMDRELQGIDREAILMFRRYLTVCDLQLGVFVIAEQIGESYPKGKLRGSVLERLHIN
jgi:hypothetical protein